MSTLSFAICAYKESPYLRECIQSLLSQKVSCPVFLSTSTPNEWIERLAGEYSLPLHVHNHKPGIAADWNSAYMSSDTEYVVIAHQDDVYEPDYAERALAALDEAAHPLIFFSDYYEIRNGRKESGMRNLKIKRLMLLPLRNPRFSSSHLVKRGVLSLGNPICCPAVAYAKANLPETPFRSGMDSNLDWDAWERFSRMKGEFLYDPHQLAGHRVHEGSTTSAIIEENKRSTEDLEILKRFWPAPLAAAINHVYKKAESSNSLDN